MSKGSRSRPFSVSQAEWDTRWDAIFSRDLKEETMSPSVEQMKEKPTPNQELGKEETK